MNVFGMTRTVAKSHEGVFIVDCFVIAVSTGRVCLNKRGFLFLGVKRSCEDALSFSNCGLFEDLVMISSGFGGPG